MNNFVKLNRVRDALNEQIRVHKDTESALRAEGRQDESVFEKIRVNVLGIFVTMLNVAEKREQNDEAAQRFFVQKLDSIPNEWQQSMKNAQAHDDEEKAHIERIKLETVAQIRAQANEIWEEWA